MLRWLVEIAGGHQRYPSEGLGLDADPAARAGDRFPRPS